MVISQNVGYIVDHILYMYILFHNAGRIQELPSFHFQRSMESITSNSRRPSIVQRRQWKIMNPRRHWENDGGRRHKGAALQHSATFSGDGVTGGVGTIRLLQRS